MASVDVTFIRFIAVKFEDRRFKKSMKKQKAKKQNCPFTHPGLD
jgi:hypothetical protein